MVVDNRVLFMFGLLLLIVFFVSPVEQPDVVEVPEPVVNESVSGKEAMIQGFESFLDSLVVYGTAVWPEHPYLALLFVAIVFYIIIVPLLKLVRRYVEYKIVGLLK